MDTKQQNKKIFIEIVKHLRELINEENIKPGDKLPSERVLSEKLNVGRSSVREALRSLELLGIIETRHGGGTFLTSIQHHQLVEIVSSFILQDNKSIEDVHKTRMMHEKEAIRIICSNSELRNLPVWDSLFVKLEIEAEVVRDHILREIIIASNNRLALKIWMQLLAYSVLPLKEHTTEDEKLMLQKLLKSMQLGYENEAINAYDDWMKFLKQLIS